MESSSEPTTEQLQDFVDNRFSEEDRKITDRQELIEILQNRVLCLSCTHYFEWSPGAMGTENSICWNCQSEWKIKEPDHFYMMQDHSPVTVVVVDPEDGEGVVMVSSEGEGWAYSDALTQYGLEVEDFFDIVGP
tara:strand:+ start:234 stop:635 length:402 start_codon:yes stop_codon:yes gene_type:complete